MTFIFHQKNKVKKYLTFRKILTLFVTLSDLWLQRALFCTTPVEQLNNWIPELLQQWPTSLDQAIINVNDESIPAKRIDGRWPWMQPIDSILGQSSSYPVINFGDGCSESTIPLNGSIALVSNLQGSSCYWSEKFIHAELAGAVGVVVYSDEGEPLKDINCRELSCYLTTIPVTMITHEAGMFIIDSLNNDDTVSMRVRSLYSIMREYFVGNGHQQ